MNPQRSQLSNGQQHFAWGPIDLIIGAQAHCVENEKLVEQAHDRAWVKFQGILPELVQELSMLKQEIQTDTINPFKGSIARSMWQACQPHLPYFITPMAAVAGAVADEMIKSYQTNSIRKAWVNNGGDIAVHLAPNQSIPIGICADADRAYDKLQSSSSFTLDGQFTISASDPVRGIATSGWQGRSFSMGIADSVTVLAHNAACADAAASMIANAVNVEDSRILRRRASDVKDDSDLGERLITVHVPTLEFDLIEQAIENGQLVAQALKDQGLIWGAILSCQQQVNYVMDRQYPMPVKLMNMTDPLTSAASMM
jgi:ApbE superfamily uncharacterized protein (UPF0280 family)